MVFLGILKSNRGSAGLVEREHVCCLWSEDHRLLHETASPRTPGYSSHRGAAAQGNAQGRTQCWLSVPLAFRPLRLSREKRALCVMLASANTAICLRCFTK